MLQKSNPPPPPPPEYHRPRSDRPERQSPNRSTHDPEPLRTSSKRKMKYEDDYYEEHPHQPREKERRHHHHHRSESEIATAVSKNSYKYADEHDYESSDDDRHFKRRPSRYEAPPAPAVEEGRHSSRGSRERERGHSSKHR